MLYLWWETGDSFAQTHAQARGWGRSLGLPPVVIWNAFTGPVLDRHELRFLVHICFALVWTVMLVELWKRRDEVPIPYLIFAAGCVLMPFAAGSLVSAGPHRHARLPALLGARDPRPARGHRHDGQGRLARAHGGAHLRDLRHTHVHAVNRLAARLRERIAASGPISFSAFMESALYDGEDGFYARGARLGARGAFTTAPIAAPFFARALAGDLRALWERLGRPEPFTLVEVGPGDGTLAAGLAAELGRPAARPRAVRARRGDARAGAGPRPGRARASSSRELAGVHGAIVANEVHDACPAHRLRWPAELLVDVGAGPALPLRPGPAGRRASAMPCSPPA